MKNMDIIPELRTGDIVLFSGQCWVSKAIKLLSRSKWSHIGLIIRDHRYPYHLIYEATKNEDLICLDAGRVSGVQLTPLVTRVKGYHGKVAVRQLKGVDLSDEALYSLYLFRKFMIGIGFEDNLLTFASAILPIPYAERMSDARLVFCSELFTQCYMEMGLLGRTPPSNKYVPAFYEESKGNTLQTLRTGKPTDSFVG